MTRLNIYKVEISTDTARFAHGLWELVRHNTQQYWVDRNLSDPSLPKKVRRIIRRLLSGKSTDTHVTRAKSSYNGWNEYMIAL